MLEKCAFAKHKIRNLLHSKSWKKASKQMEQNKMFQHEFARPNDFQMNQNQWTHLPSKKLVLQERKSPMVGNKEL